MMRRLQIFDPGRHFIDPEKKIVVFRMTENRHSGLQKLCFIFCKNISLLPWHTSSYNMECSTDSHLSVGKLGLRYLFHSFHMRNSLDGKTHHHMIPLPPSTPPEGTQRDIDHIIGFEAGEYESFMNNTPPTSLLRKRSVSLMWKRGAPHASLRVNGAPKASPSVMNTLQIHAV